MAAGGRRSTRRHSTRRVQHRTRSSPGSSSGFSDACAPTIRPATSTSQRPCGHERRGDRHLEAHEAETDCPTERVAIGAHLQVADRVAVEVDDLVAEKQGFGIRQEDLQHSPRRRARALGSTQVLRVR